MFVTASVLILSTLLWWASSLKFQAEMGLLMAIWLGISATSALFVMPAIIYVFRPEFIFGRQDKPVLGELKGYRSASKKGMVVSTFVVHTTGEGGASMKRKPERERRAAPPD